MLYKFVKKYAKRVATLSRSTLSALSSFDSECGANPGKEFVPTLILCGSPQSGTVEIFNQYLLDTESEQQSQKSNESSYGPTGRKKSGIAPQKVSVESDDLTAPLKSTQSAEEQLETIAVWTKPGESGSTYEPIHRLAAEFDYVRGNLVNLPSEARFDESLVAKLDGSICYLIPLDTFDVPSTAGQFKSLLEQEIEQAKKLALLDRKSDNSRFLLMFTRVKEFQEKVQIDRSKLSSWMNIDNTDGSILELTSAVIDLLSRQVAKSASVKATYVYPAEDVPAAQNVLRIMVHSLYLSDNLRLAGFME